jgi:dCMP deaminase
MKWDLRFLELAKLVSTWSKDPSTQVGAVIVDPDKRIVSVGFNGFPQMMEDRAEWLNNRDEKYSRIIHGEMNALLFAGKSVQGCTLYTYPCLSCDRCAVHMIQAGIMQFVAPYPSEDMLSRWSESLTRTRTYIEQCGGEAVEVR